MRAASLVGCVLYAALGCAAPRQGRPAESGVTGVSAPAEVERGVLGYVHEGDTTVIEEYTRTARMLEGIVRPQVQGAKFGWARYRVELGPSGAAERAVLEIGRRSDESKPVHTWTATIRGREVVEVSTQGLSNRVSVSETVVPLFAPSMAMFHEAIRQTHRLSGSRGRASVLVYFMASSGELDPVTIEWPASDTAAVRHSSGPATLYVVDTRGRLLGSRGQDGRHLVVRLR